MPTNKTTLLKAENRKNRREAEAEREREREREREMAGIGEGQRRQGGRPPGPPPRAQFPPRPRFEPVDREKVYMVFLTFPRVSDFVP